MGWTIRWFRHHVEKWTNQTRKASEDRLPGHQAYAEKQKLMWEEFANVAEKAFLGKWRE
jgi:hypothetical protein